MPDQGSTVKVVVGVYARVSKAFQLAAGCRGLRWVLRHGARGWVGRWSTEPLRAEHFVST